MKNSEICLTFDTDWCRQEHVDEIIALLEERKLKSTFFITDDNPIIVSKNVEIALHPNIENKSLDIIDNDLKKMKSGKKSFGVRTHKLYSSSILNSILENNEIQYQSNYVLFLKDNIEVCKGLNGVYEVPIYCMDYYLMEFFGRVPNYTTLKQKFFNGKGIKVFDFHPIHIYMNTPSLDYYYQEREKMTINKKTYGVKDFFLELIDDLNGKNIKFMKELI